QAPQCRGRQDRAPTDVMHDVEIFGDVQPTRLCQCRTLPAKIVDANAAFPLLRLSRHIDPNHMRCWTAVFEELGLRRLPVQRMRQDPRVMMPGQVPGPVPGKPRLRTLPWPEGVADQQDFQPSLRNMSRRLARHLAPSPMYKDVKSGPALWRALPESGGRIQAGPPP